jgi:hypothetical protein
MLLAWFASFSLYWREMGSILLPPRSSATQHSQCDRDHDQLQDQDSREELFSVAISTQSSQVKDVRPPSLFAHSAGESSGKAGEQPVVKLCTSHDRAAGFPRTLTRYREGSRWQRRLGIAINKLAGWKGFRQVRTEIDGDRSYL